MKAPWLWHGSFVIHPYFLGGWGGTGQTWLISKFMSYNHHFHGEICHFPVPDINFVPNATWLHHLLLYILYNVHLHMLMYIFLIWMLIRRQCRVWSLLRRMSLITCNSLLQVILVVMSECAMTLVSHLSQCSNLSYCRPWRWWEHWQLSS